MIKVTVVDYGAGNLLNVVRALEHCGAAVTATDRPELIASADRLVFPGVGAFGDCMQVLRRRGIAEAIIKYIRSGRLFLGICVGMQVMFEAGEEFGEHAGLGILAGRVVRITDKGTNGMPHKIPHIGWSRLERPSHIISWKDTLLAPLDQVQAPAAYFVHSYMGVPTAPEDCLAEVDYDGIRICAAVKQGNAYGCQFHPEKSGELGLNILRQFLQLPLG